MTISLVVDGSEYSGFITASVTQSMRDVANQFAFEATAADGVPLPFKGKEACQVFVGGNLKLTGHIELIGTSGGKESHSITIAGRDKCGDLIDSDLDVIEDIQGSITLKRICELVISHLNLRINVIDQVGPAIFEEGYDLSSPEPGENAMDYLETLARSRQVLLTSDENGDLNILRTQGVVAQGSFIHHRVGDPQERNNVLDYESSLDFTDMFFFYKTSSSTSVTASALDTIGLSPEYMANQLARVIDPTMNSRNGRQKVIVDESSMTTGLGQDRARWERDFKRAQGQIYSCKVFGHQHAGEEDWETNRLTPILTEYSGINKQMVLETVQFSQGPGTHSRLTFIDKDAYTLAVSEPQEEEGFGIFGG